MSETLLINGHVVDPAQRIDGVRHLALRDGKIAEVSERPFDAKRLEAAQVIDAKGRFVFPGLIDLHVHLREPGEEYKETIATGTLAAVAGGFTAVVSMPNTKPVNDSGAITDLILKQAKAAGLARVFPAGAASKGQKGEELAEIGELVEAGCRMVTDDGKPVSNSKLMRRVLEYTTVFDIPVMAHEEEPGLAGKGVMHEGTVSTRLGLRGVPAAAEVTMLARDIELLALTGGRLHVGHLSCEGSVDLVRAAKRRGLKITAEATPHHFTLTDEAVVGYDTSTKVNPPLRSARDRDAVIAGLADGTIDAIATDHAPHSPIEKDLEYDHAACGLVGLETALPLALALVRAGKLTMAQLVERMSIGPAKIIGVEGGSLAVGRAADITVVAVDEKWTCDPAKFKTKSRNTPFAGMALVGRAKLTLVDGRVVWRDEAR